MQKWNSRIQMTATKKLDEFVERHVIDSLELASELEDKEARMLDVGSGGGLPGIVLAIARPRIQFTLIEPTKKKAAFLTTARRELQLSNLDCLAVRDDELIASSSFQPFDYAVARAVWALELWLERARSLVHANGVIFGMEGLDESDLPAGASRRRYSLENGRSRAIIRYPVGG